MLHHLGHRVTLAMDGGEGVEMARARRFDLILMDLSMPLMDGWTAATVIRMGGASQHSRILAVTAHVRPDTMERFAESGIDGWLAKPLSTRSLSEALALGHAVPPGLAPEVSEALLDMERLEDLRQITDGAGLGRLLETFRSHVEKTLAEVENGAETAPFAVMAELLHASVGAAAVVGAKRLCQDFAQAEAAAVACDRLALQTACKAFPATWRATWVAFGKETQGR